ncbi:RDD family protein [Actinomadura madurae]|nr:RDD family protein [Actinomadura madurae]MCQ0015973.1 RDD family protein [Actinomadura madurae]
MAELVTGEAVALDLRVARLASRGCAILLDLLFQAVLLNVLLYVTLMTSLVADDAWTAGLTILVVAAVFVGYPCLFETLTRGRTLGKMALGLRVVADDGGPIRFRQALLRALAGVVEFWMFYGSPALITSFCNRRGKRLGDLFAGTIVIQERVPVSMLYGPVAVMPPQLAWWARTLELSMLSDELAMTARQYLSRFWELLPEVRDSLGERIASQVVAVVSPPPPPGGAARDPAVGRARRAPPPGGAAAGRAVGAADAPVRAAGVGCRSRAGTRDGDGRARAVGAAAAGSAGPAAVQHPRAGAAAVPSAVRLRRGALPERPERAPAARPLPDGPGGCPDAAGAVSGLLRRQLGSDRSFSVRVGRSFFMHSTGLKAPLLVMKWVASAGHSRSAVTRPTTLATAWPDPHSALSRSPMVNEGSSMQSPGDRTPPPGPRHSTGRAMFPPPKERSLMASSVWDGHDFSVSTRAITLPYQSSSEHGCSLPKPMEPLLTQSPTARKAPPAPGSPG